jgi:hypothetical protein
MQPREPQTETLLNQHIPWDTVPSFKTIVNSPDNTYYLTLDTRWAWDVAGSYTPRVP